MCNSLLLLSRSLSDGIPSKYVLESTVSSIDLRVCKGNRRAKACCCQIEIINWVLMFCFYSLCPLYWFWLRLCLLNYMYNVIYSCLCINVLYFQIFLFRNASDRGNFWVGGLNILGHHHLWCHQGVGGVLPHIGPVCHGCGLEGKAIIKTFFI